MKSFLENIAFVEKATISDHKNHCTGYHLAPGSTLRPASAVLHFYKLDHFQDICVTFGDLKGNIRYLI